MLPGVWNFSRKSPQSYNFSNCLDFIKIHFKGTENALIVLDLTADIDMEINK